MSPVVRTGIHASSPRSNTGSNSDAAEETEADAEAEVPHWLPREVVGRRQVFKSNVVAKMWKAFKLRGRARDEKCESMGMAAELVPWSDEARRGRRAGCQ